MATHIALNGAVVTNDPTKAWTGPAFLCDKPHETRVAEFADAGRTLCPHCVDVFEQSYDHVCPDCLAIARAAQSDGRSGRCQRAA